MIHLADERRLLTIHQNTRCRLEPIHEHTLQKNMRRLKENRNTEFIHGIDGKGLGNIPRYTLSMKMYTDKYTEMETETWQIKREFN